MPRNDLKLPPVVQTGLRRALWLTLPCALFLAFFHVEILDPTRIHWIMHEDWGQHALGWHALRNSPWTWPFNHHDLLSHPTGLSIIYTDSNPAFAFFFKLLSPFLPANFQYIGLWFLLCIIGQVIASYALLRRHAPGPWMAMAGTLLMCLLPALYHRMIHDTLMAHWLILGALYIFLEVSSERRRAIGWAVLLGVAGLLHPYILFIILAIWGGDLLRLAGPAWATRDHRFLANLVLRAGVTLVVPLLALALVGAFSGQSMGDDGFGTYSMALDAPFNPGRDGWSLFLKAHPVVPGQADEGFQYMGVGLLFLIAAACLLYRYDNGAKTVRPLFDRLRQLKWPLIILLALAISTQVYFSDHRIFKLSVPDPLKPVFSILRASGRFFWPIAYLAVWLALTTVFRSNPKRARTVLAVALALQIVDLSGFAAAMREKTATAKETRPYVLTPSPQWDRLIAGANLVEFQPPNPYIDKPLFYELSWRSVSHHLPVSTMYTARQNPAQKALEEQGRLDFLRGKTDPRHLYIFMNRCNAPRALQGRLRQLDGVWFVPPVALQNVVTVAPEPVAYRVGEPIEFAWNDTGACALDDAFAMPESEGSWSVKPAFAMDLTFAEPISAGSIVELTLHSYKKPRTVKVFADGRQVSELSLTRKDSTVRFTLPALSDPQRLVLRFETPEPAVKPARGQPGRFVFISKLTVLPPQT